MSNAHVYVNGKLATVWPYGYNSFYVDVTSMVHPGENTVRVSLENKERSSRWYPAPGYTAMSTFFRPTKCIYRYGALS